MSASTNLKEPTDRQRRSSGPAVRDQLGRLFRLTLMLQSGTTPNAKELAETCEVSKRTVYRDLGLLEAAGVPLRYNPERQGYQLDKGYFLQPTGLTEEEVRSLLVLARQWDENAGLGLAPLARRGAEKLVQALPVESRERVSAWARPFQESRGSWRLAEARDAVKAALISALGTQRQLRIWYQEPKSLAERCTRFSLYRMHLHEGRWYLVGRSSLERRVEAIGLDQVLCLVPTDDVLSVPARFDLERFLGQAWGVDRLPRRSRVWLRFSPRAVAEIESRVWHKSQRLVKRRDGQIDVFFHVDGLEDMVGWVLGFGEDVEVLAPRELRTRLHELSQGLMSRYAIEPEEDETGAFSIFR